MNDLRYKIIFSGIPLPPLSEAQLCDGLVKIFKITPEKARSMIGRGPRTLKKNITLEQAERYLALLEEAGAVARKEVQAESAANAPQARAAAAGNLPVHNAQAKIPEKAAEKNQEHKRAHWLRAHYAEPPSAADSKEHHSGTDSQWQDEGELNPHTVQGRIGRLRYMAWLMAALLVLAPLAWGVTHISSPAPMILAILLLTVASLLYLVRFMAQRLHDIGLSAWCALVLLIPVAGEIAMLALAVWPGNNAENDYGAPPPPNGKMVHLLAALWLAIGPLWLRHGDSISFDLFHGAIQNSSAFSAEEKKEFEKIHQLQQLAIKIHQRGGQPTEAEQQEMERLMQEIKAEQATKRRK